MHGVIIQILWYDNLKILFLVITFQRAKEYITSSYLVWVTRQYTAELIV